MSGSPLREGLGRFSGHINVIGIDAVAAWVDQMNICYLLNQIQDIANWKNCERCGLRRRKTDRHCMHCFQLSDEGVTGLQERYAREHAGNARFGNHLVFLAVMATTVILLLVIGIYVIIG